MKTRRSSRLVAKEVGVTSVCKVPTPTPTESPCLTKPRRKRRTKACIEKFKNPNPSNLKVNFCAGMKTYSRRKSIQTSPSISSPEIKFADETSEVHVHDVMKTHLQNKPIIDTIANNSPEVVETTMNTNETSSQTEVKTPNYTSKHEKAPLELFNLNETISVSLEIVETTENIIGNYDFETQLGECLEDIERHFTNGSVSENIEIDKTPDSILDHEAIESSEHQDNKQPRITAENKTPCLGETISAESVNIEIEQTPDSILDHEAIESSEVQDNKNPHFTAENETPVLGEKISAESENIEIEQTPDSILDHEAIESSEGRDFQKPHFTAENDTADRVEPISAESENIEIEQTPDSILDHEAIESSERQDDKDPRFTSENETPLHGEKISAESEHIEIEQTPDSILDHEAIESSKRQDDINPRVTAENETPVRGNTISSESENIQTEHTPESFLDDEAIDSYNYESGDSLGEEERRNIVENEIPIRGERITSESDYVDSNSDYERDSFVVSSDPEDNQLLDTSSDLGYSDNELQMNKHSKQKYNERKLKEQKAASREMFLARHGPHPDDASKPLFRSSKIQNQSTNGYRLRIDSSESEVSTKTEFTATRTKKSARRIDSDSHTENDETNMDIQERFKESSKKILKRKTTLRIDSSDSEDEDEIKTSCTDKVKRRRRLESDLVDNDDTSIADNNLIVRKECQNDTKPGQSITIVSEELKKLQDDSGSDSGDNIATNFKHKQRRNNSRRLSSESQMENDETNIDFQDHVLIDKESSKKTLKRKNTLRIDSSDSEDNPNTFIVIVCEESQNKQDDGTSDSNTKDHLKNKRKKKRPKSDCLVDETTVDVVDHVKAGSSQNAINLVTEESKNTQDDGSSYSNIKTYVNNKRQGRRRESELSVENDKTVDPILINRNESQNEKLSMPSQDVDSTKNNFPNNVTSLVSKKSQYIQDDGNSDSNTKINLKNKRKRKPPKSVQNDETTNAINLVSEESQNTQDDGSSYSNIKTYVKNKRTRKQPKSDCLVDETTIDVVDHAKPGSSQDIASANTTAQNDFITLKKKYTVQINTSDSEDANKINVKNKRKKNKVAPLNAEYPIETGETSINSLEIEPATKTVPSNNIAGDKEMVVTKVPAPVIAALYLDHHSDSSSSSIDVRTLLPKWFYKRSKKTKKSSTSYRERIAMEEEMLFRVDTTNISEPPADPAAPAEPPRGVASVISTVKPPAEPARDVASVIPTAKRRAKPTRAVASVISTAKLSVESIRPPMGAIKPASTSVFHISLEDNPRLSSVRKLF